MTAHDRYVARIKSEEPMEPEAVSTPGIPVRYAPPLPDNPIERAQRALDQHRIPRLPPHVIDIILRAAAERPNIMGIPVEISNEIPEGMMRFKMPTPQPIRFTEEQVAEMKRQMRTGPPEAVPHAPAYERSPLLDALYDLALGSRGLRWRLQQEGASHALVTADRTGSTVPHLELRIRSKDAWTYSRGQWRQMLEDMLDGKTTEVTPFVITTGQQ